MRNTLFFTFLALVTLLLHGIWEHAHIALYTGYEALEGILPVWVFATIGDFVYTLLAVVLVGAILQDMQWFEKDFSKIRYFSLAAIGFLIALMVEYKGLYLGRWEYLLSMPLIPLLQVGLSPILQMTILLPISVFITRLLTKQF